MNDVIKEAFSKFLKYDANKNRQEDQLKSCLEAFKHSRTLRHEALQELGTLLSKSGLWEEKHCVYENFLLKLTWSPMCGYNAEITKIEVLT